MTVYSSPRISLPRLSYTVFIYVGTLTLYLQPHVQADVDFQANICDDSTILRARAGVEPRFTFTVEGGIQADIAVRVSACSIVLMDNRIRNQCYCFQCVYITIYIAGAV